jgi:hypothetical protein
MVRPCKGVAAGHRELRHEVVLSLSELAQLDFGPNGQKGGDHAAFCVESVGLMVGKVKTRTNVFRKGGKQKQVRGAVDKAGRVGFGKVVVELVERGLKPVLCDAPR